MFENKNLLKLNPDSKIKVLTHNDMDGSGPVIMLKTYFKNVEVEHCSTGNMSFKVKNAITDEFTENKYDAIFATDISVNEKDAEIIERCDSKNKLILLDHHATAEDLNKYSWAYVSSVDKSDNRKHYYPDNVEILASGTSLTFDYLVEAGYFDISNEKIKMLNAITFMITAYDTWDWVAIFDSNEIFQDLNTLFDEYTGPQFEKKIINLLDNADYDEDFITNPIENMRKTFNQVDTFLITLHELHVKQHINRIRFGIQTAKLTLGDKTLKACIVSNSCFCVEVFDYMQDQFPDCDVYLMNFGTSMSMRTMRTDIDISEIVGKLNGGGHQGAGGFRYSYDLVNNFMAEALNAKIEILPREKYPIEV